jgi:hypothetical protein
VGEERFDLVESERTTFDGPGALERVHFGSRDVLAKTVFPSGAQCHANVFYNLLAVQVWFA